MKQAQRQLTHSVGEYWDELCTSMGRLSPELTAEVAQALLACYDRGGTIFLIGNGGSAATASHFACDLSKGTRIHGLAPIRCMPLTDNVPLMTAWANDASYAHIFAEQLKALVRGSDLVVAISVSGNSTNVVAAIEAAQEAGAATVALTGQGGGRLGRLADIAVRAPTRSVEQAEDIHMAICHTVCVALRELLQSRATNKFANDVETQVVQLDDQVPARLKKRAVVA